MIDYENFKVMHRHGPEWVDGKPVDPHDLAARDPERLWAKGAKLYQCDACGGIVSLAPVEDPSDPGPESSGLQANPS